MPCIYNGVVLQGYRGRCSVCGEFILEDTSYQAHKHPGHPQSIFDANGWCRSDWRSVVAQPPSLTVAQEKLIADAVEHMKRTSG